MLECVVKTLPSGNTLEVHVFEADIYSNKYKRNGGLNFTKNIYFLEIIRGSTNRYITTKSKEVVKILDSGQADIRGQTPRSKFGRLMQKFEQMACELVGEPLPSPTAVTAPANTREITAEDLAEIAASL